MEPAWVAIGLSALNLLALVYLATRKESAEEKRRQHEQIEHIERELATVDNRIQIACHSRVKRAGEYWEFHNRVENFMDAVQRTGIIK